MTTGFARLTAEQIRDFHEQGFLRLGALPSGEEVSTLADVYDRLFAPDAVIAEADRVELSSDSEGRPVLPQVLNPDHYVPELRLTTAYANPEEIAYQLLGEEARHMGMHAIRKPARSVGETPWHQNEADWDRLRAPGGQCVDAAAAGDARQRMHAVRPSQPSVGRAHSKPRRCRRAGAHRDRSGGGGRRGGVPLPSGGATVHAGRTLHYTGPNRTDQPRRARVMAFARPGVPLDEPMDFCWQSPEWYA